MTIPDDVMARLARAAVRKEDRYFDSGGGDQQEAMTWALAAAFAAAANEGWVLVEADDLPSPRDYERSHQNHHDWTDGFNTAAELMQEALDRRVTDSDQTEGEQK